MLAKLMELYELHGAPENMVGCRHWGVPGERQGSSSSSSGGGKQAVRESIGGQEHILLQRFLRV